MIRSDHGPAWLHSERTAALRQLGKKDASQSDLARSSGAVRAVGDIVLRSAFQLHDRQILAVTDEVDVKVELHAWLSQISPDDQATILFLSRVKPGRDPISERNLRRIRNMADWRKQRRMWTSATRLSVSGELAGSIYSRAS